MSLLDGLFRIIATLVCMAMVFLLLKWAAEAITDLYKEYRGATSSMPSREAELGD